MPDASSTISGKKMEGIPEGEVPSVPSKKWENLSADSLADCINISKSNASRQSLKSSDSPDLKHPPLMIEGIDLITSENAKQLFECDKHKYSSKTNIERFR